MATQLHHLAACCEVSETDSTMTNRLLAMPARLVFLALIFLCTVGTAVLDWLTPLGITVWVLYAIPLVLTFWVSEPRAPMVVAAACSILIVSMLGVSDRIPPQAAVNRLMGIAGLWIIALLLIKIKAANRAVQDSEREARTILNAALDAVIGSNSEGRITYWNRQAEALFGWAGSEVLGRSLSETIIPPHLRDAYLRGLAGARVTGEGPILNRRTESAALRADGTEFPVELIVVPIRRQDEWHFFAFIEDLTERKRYEETLLADHARFRAITEASPIAMVVTRPDDGTIVYANTQFATLFGIPLEETGSYCAAQFYDSPADRAIVLSRLHDKPLVEQHELMLRKPDGTRFWALVAIRRLELDGDEVLLTGIQDLTERKRIEEELSRLSTTLEQRVQQRTEELQALNVELDKHDRAKSAFVSMVSHELRSPMTTIKGYVENMLTGLTGPLTEKQQHYLTRVLHNVVRLTRLTGDLLDLSRIEAGMVPLQPERVSLPALVSEVQEAFERTVHMKGITMHVHTEPDLPEIVVDRDKLHQVVTNLVENAVKYSGEGGEVDLSMHVRSDDMLELCVRDTGPGIHSEDLEKIFEPFYRGRMSRTIITGAGVGLAVAKRFVELHGGRIWVESTPGIGSWFYVTLPLRAGEA